MRQRLLCGAGGLALTILLISGGSASAADPSARLGKLNCEAGDVAQFDGQRWVCAPMGGGGSDLVLLDANGEPFGTILDFDSFGGDKNITIHKTFEIPSSGEMVNVLLGVRPGSIGAVGDGNSFGLYFESNDCSGQPFLLGFSPSTPHNITPPPPPAASLWGIYRDAISVFPDLLGDVLELWIVPDDTPQEVNLFSIFNGNCDRAVHAPEPTPLVTQAFPAELVDPNLHETFPPPYTLELQDGR